MSESNLGGLAARLDGKVAVVLGASAEGGTGWAVAEALARNGAKVVVGARSLKPLRVLAERISGTAVACDASDESQVKALANAAIGTYGKLHIAVNAAGAPAMSMIANVEQSHLNAAIQLNFFGHVYFVKHMAAAMREGGSIALISSLSATHPVLPHAPYACAKAATDCLVRYAALEYAPKKIRINSILPGGIKSAMAKEAFEIPGFEAAFAREVPLGRIGVPEDVADAVLFLAGAAYITGVNLNYNGGGQLTRMPYLDELPGGRAAYVSGEFAGNAQAKE